MNIEKMKDWCYDNWQTIIVILIIAIVGASACNYKNESSQKYKGCAEFDMIDKFEENPTTSGFIIYYSDGRVKEERWLPDCIKLRKTE